MDLLHNKANLARSNQAAANSRRIEIAAKMLYTTRRVWLAAKSVVFYQRFV